MDWILPYLDPGDNLLFNKPRKERIGMGRRVNLVGENKSAIRVLRRISVRRTK